MKLTEFSPTSNPSSQSPTHQTKIGIGWREELALAIERCNSLDFVELTAENFCESHEIPQPIKQLSARGIEIIIHSTAMSLGSAEPHSVECSSTKHSPAGYSSAAERSAKRRVIERLKAIRYLKERTSATLISDHIAFVRSAAYESGHLLPVERTLEMLEIICENVRIAQDVLQTPLALENIATLFEWPHAELTEPEFIGEIVRRTNSQLLLDVSNLYANSVNHKFDTAQYLDQLPLDKLAYVHIAGGVFRDGLYHDTHTGSIHSGAFAVLHQLAQRVRIPRIMVEIDDDFPSENALFACLDAIKEVVV